MKGPVAEMEGAEFFLFLLLLFVVGDYIEATDDAEKMIVAASDPFVKDSLELLLAVPER